MDQTRKERSEAKIQAEEEVQKSEGTGREALVKAEP
jgi:hypothetical protein